MARIKASELELKDKLVHINRVAKVVKGGRRLSVSALAAGGDGNGKGRRATGKANKGAGAVPQGTGDARRRMRPGPQEAAQQLPCPYALHLASVHRGAVDECAALATACDQTLVPQTVDDLRRRGIDLPGTQPLVQLAHRRDAKLPQHGEDRVFQIAGRETDLPHHRNLRHSA